MVSAHICYWLEKRGKYDRTRGKEQADRGRDTGVVVDLGGQGRIFWGGGQGGFWALQEG